MLCWVLSGDIDVNCTTFTLPFNMHTDTNSHSQGDLKTYKQTKNSNNKTIIKCSQIISLLMYPQYTYIKYRNVMCRLCSYSTKMTYNFTKS